MANQKQTSKNQSKRGQQPQSNRQQTPQQGGFSQLSRQWDSDR